MKESPKDTPSPGPLPAEPIKQDKDQELYMFLERDQLVADTSIPVGRVTLGPRARAGLWLLRVFVVVVSFMVIYTFIAQLH